MNFTEIENSISLVRNNPQSVSDPGKHLLLLGEKILENWLESHQLEPTQSEHEGFRLLALHRQGAKFDPAFLACRETCRELVYQVNLYHMKNDIAQVNMMAMVTLHLLLFIRGKLEDQQLGEFCCSSKPLRNRQTDSNWE